MKLVATMLLSLFGAGVAFTTAPAEDRKADAFFILDERSGWTFDMNAWEKAASAIDVAGHVHTYRSDGDASVTARARDEAARVNATGNIVNLQTMRTEDRDARQFRQSLRALKQSFDASPVLKGSTVVMEQPMCALVQHSRPKDPGLPQQTTLIILDHPQAAVFCYPLVLSYYTTPPGPDGKRVAPVSFDAATLALQAKMPRMSFARKALVDKAEFGRGNFVERNSTIYAAGEEIFIYAGFENVGRKEVGSPYATYEIGLDIEVRDTAGKVLKALPDANVFKGQSPPPFPVNMDYFTNYATAGIALHDAGDYTLAYIFEDRSRPEMPPVEATFDVTISSKANAGTDR